MAVISMNRTSELVHKLFSILIQEPGGLKAHVAIEWLASQFYDKLNDHARRRFPLTPIYFLTPEG